MRICPVPLGWQFYAVGNMHIHCRHFSGSKGILCGRATDEQHPHLPKHKTFNNKEESVL